MAALDFPDAPTVGQVFDKWTWNGTMWELTAGVAPTAWTAVTFLNGWSNYGSGFQTMQYRKVGDIVYLRGFVKGGTASTAVFALPVGYRPPATTRFATLNTGVTTGYWEMTSAGNVVHQAGAVGDVSVNFTFSTIA
jgi:hypothetical protein